MNDKRTIRFIIIFALLMIAMMAADSWRRHDVPDLYIHIVLLICIAILIGLFSKYWRNWKHYGIVSFSLQFLAFGVFSIEQWHRGSHKWSILFGTVCVIALVNLIGEIVKQRSREFVVKDDIG